MLQAKLLAQLPEPLVREVLAKLLALLEPKTGRRFHERRLTRGRRMELRSPSRGGVH